MIGLEFLFFFFSLFPRLETGESIVVCCVVSSSDFLVDDLAAVQQQHHCCSWKGERESAEKPIWLMQLTGAKEEEEGGKRQAKMLQQETQNGKCCAVYWLSAVCCGWSSSSSVCFCSVPQLLVASCFCMSAARRSYWSCHQQVACSLSLSLSLSFSTSHALGRTVPPDPSAGANDATTVFSLFLSLSLVICHNIVADDRSHCTHTHTREQLTFVLPSSRRARVTHNRKKVCPFFFVIFFFLFF